MKKSICFGCKHFKQYQDLKTQTPGMCQWEPTESVPEWLQTWLGSTDRYHGPSRETSTVFPVQTCEAFEEKPNG